MGSVPGLEDPIEEELATHSSVLAWETPWTEQPWGRKGVGNDHVIEHTPSQSRGALHRPAAWGEPLRTPVPIPLSLQLELAASASPAPFQALGQAQNQEKRLRGCSPGRRRGRGGSEPGARREARPLPGGPRRRGMRGSGPPEGGARPREPGCGVSRACAMRRFPAVWRNCLAVSRRLATSSAPGPAAVWRHGVALQRGPAADGLGRLHRAVSGGRAGRLLRARSPLRRGLPRHPKRGARDQGACRVAQPAVSESPFRAATTTRVTQLGARRPRRASLAGSSPRRENKGGVPLRSARWSA